MIDSRVNTSHYQRFFSHLYILHCIHGDLSLVRITLATGDYRVHLRILGSDRESFSKSTTNYEFKSEKAPLTM